MEKLLKFFSQNKNLLKNLVSRFAQNKKTLLLAFGVVMILSFLPAHYAQAAWWNDLVNGIGNVFQWITTLPLKIAGLVVTLFLFIFSLATAFLFFIVTNLLSWIKTICLVVPITHGGVVDTGWAFTRDFANMFFILILVFIGLATILRLKEYEVKKTLPLLLLVAILINFTPVIVGLVVDVSNIFTNFFLSKTGASVDSFVDVFNQGWTAIKSALVSFAQFEDIMTVLGNIVGGVLFSVALLIFYGYATAVYCFVIFLLILRIAYLWVLMILAPLAFLSYIFPGTKKLPLLGWDEWWKELIRWSIIGIPLGFFLYLSTWIMQNQPVIAEFFPSPSITNPTADPIFSTVIGGFASLLGSMIVPFVALLILHLGTKMAKKLAPEMALQAIEGIKKGIKMAGSIALIAATGGAAAGLAAKGLGGLAKGAQGLEGLAEKVPGVGGALKWGAKPVSWATRGINEVYGSQLREYEAKTKRIPEGDLKNIDGMVWSEQKAYIDGKTSLLPKKLKEDRQLQFGAHMADKETLEFADDGFQVEVATDARSAFTNKDSHFRKEAMMVAKNIPDKVFEGGEGAKAYAEMKAFGKKDKPGDSAYTNTYNSALVEIEKNRKEVENRLKGDRDNLIIETGIKYNFITKDDVAADRNKAIQDAENQIRFMYTDVQREIDKTAKEMAIKAAPVVTFIVDKIKPGDVRKIADPKTLGTRVGLSLGNPSNLQQLQENFGRKVVEDIFNGTGGINSLTEAELKKINNPMHKFLSGNSPAAQRMPWNPKSGGPGPGGGPGPTPSSGGGPGSGGGGPTPGPGPTSGGPTSGGPTSGGPTGGGSTSGGSTPGGSAGGGPTGGGSATGGPGPVPGPTPGPTSTPTPPTSPRLEPQLLPQLLEMIDRIKHQKQQGTYKDIGMAVQPGSMLHDFLLDNGVTREEFNKMETDDVYNKAIEIAERLKKIPGPTPGPTPGATPSPSATKPPSSVLEAIKEAKEEKQKGTFSPPMMIGQRLQKFLRDNGVAQEEIGKMNSNAAWEKAIEIAERFGWL